MKALVLILVVATLSSCGTYHRRTKISVYQETSRDTQFVIANNQIVIFK